MKRLAFNIEFYGNIIVSSMLLYNFIIDYCAKHADNEYFAKFNLSEESQFLYLFANFSVRTNIDEVDEALYAIVSNNDTTKSSGQTAFLVC